MEDYTVRTTPFYAAEGIVGIILSAIFFYFARVYCRQFVKMWAYSWLAFSFAMVALILLNAVSIGSTPMIRHFFSFLSILLRLFQIFFLLVGSIALVRSRRVSKREFIIWSMVVFACSLAVTLPFLLDPAGSLARYLIRLGSQYFVVGIGFVTAAYITSRSLRLAKGIGKILMAVSFLIYGCYHLYYVGVVISNVISKQFYFPSLFGLVELVIVSTTGLSMAIWLLEDERQSLQNTNRQLDDFFYRVSHDLRSPIATIQGLNNLARLQLKEKESKDYIERIETSVARLDSVIHDLTRISNHRNLEAKLQTTDFNVLVSEIRDHFHRAGQGQSIDIIYSDRIENVLVTDQVLLKSVLLNLIDNAIDFSRIGTTPPYVQISFSRVARRVIITVEDNGLGMHKESLSRIFNMFYKEDLGSKRSGLGLYSVKIMLEKLNGTISVRSDLGSGSAFVIVLPSL